MRGCPVFALRLLLLSWLLFATVLSLNKGRKDTERREATWRSPDVRWMLKDVPHKMEHISFETENRFHSLCTRTQRLSPESCLIRADNLLDLMKTACSVRLPKGEDEFKLNFPRSGFEYEVQWVNRRLFVCSALLKSQCSSSALTSLLFNTPHDWLHSL